MHLLTKFQTFYPKWNKNLETIADNLIFQKLEFFEQLLIGPNFLYVIFKQG